MRNSFPNDFLSRFDTVGFACILILPSYMKSLFHYTFYIKYPI